MSILKKLQKELESLEDKQIHDGYWYTISEALIVFVCGMLCGLQRIDDIHDWAKANLTRSFLEKDFFTRSIL